jgi:hypothetical protein
MNILQYLANWLTPEPHWTLLAIISGVVGVLISQVPAAVENIRDYHKRHRIVGGWNSYYFARRNGRMVLHAERWEVTASWFRGIRVTAQAPFDPERSYIGRIRAEMNQLYITFHSRSHEESVVIRLKQPIDLSTRRMVGIGLSYDFDVNPHACVNVLSADAMTEDQVRQCIATVCVVETLTGNIILVPKHASVQPFMNWPQDR